MGFATDHVTNHADPGAIYMGEVVWSFLGPDHIQTHWWSFQDGVKSDPLTFDLHRVP